MCCSKRAGASQIRAAPKVLKYAVQTRFWLAPGGFQPLPSQVFANYDIDGAGFSDACFRTEQGQKFANEI